MIIGLSENGEPDKRKTVNIHTNYLLENLEKEFSIHSDDVKKYLIFLVFYFCNCPVPCRAKSSMKIGELSHSTWPDIGICVSLLSQAYVTADFMCY